MKYTKGTAGEEDSETTEPGEDTAGWPRRCPDEGGDARDGETTELEAQ